MTPPYRVMVCPVCIEKQSYYGRLSWQGEPDVKCPHHKVALVEPPKKVLDKPPK